jgi:uncharacterized protein
MRVFYFEIPSSDCNRSLDFYSRAFGWKGSEFPAETPYYFVSTGDSSEAGIDGGIMQRFDPGQPVVNIIRVDSVDESCREIEDAGGTIVVPKFEVPGVGFKAYFKDPDGNIFGIAQMIEA